ncbi:type II toxin-antitoxin system RelE/ParE family toxin [Candidatus Woesearchaeota archaeon]|nr:type II toxin-antitoxin system RelE/ParE family toxin [Candidatus Woesearchaeota archaeon]
MVNVSFDPLFEKLVKKIKDQTQKEKIKKKILKIAENPEIGKPMMYNRKGTRELYIEPFRISYLYNKEENKVVFLDLYHKDEQ